MHVPQVVELCGDLGHGEGKRMELRETTRPPVGEDTTARRRGVVMEKDGPPRPASSRDLRAAEP